MNNNNIDMNTIHVCLNNILKELHDIRNRYNTIDYYIQNDYLNRNNQVNNLLNIIFLIYTYCFK